MIGSEGRDKSRSANEPINWNAILGFRAVVLLTPRRQLPSSFNLITNRRNQTFCSLLFLLRSTVLLSLNIATVRSQSRHISACSSSSTMNRSIGICDRQRNTILYGEIKILSNATLRDRETLQQRSQVTTSHPRNRCREGGGKGGKLEKRKEIYRSRKKHVATE